MVNFPDVIIDLETTGISPDHANIFQIAAVKFNVKTREVCPDIFSRNLFFTKNRYWEEGTRSFWKQNQPVFEKLMQDRVDPESALTDLVKWLDGSNILWAKPSHFEFPFLDSYFKQFNVTNPFHYRDVQDLNSFLRGLCFPDTVPQTEYNSGGEALHDARTDCLLELKRLMEILGRVRGCS